MPAMSSAQVLLREWASDSASDYLRVGDIVELGIEGLGAETRMVAASKVGSTALTTSL